MAVPNTKSRYYCVVGSVVEGSEELETKHQTSLTGPSEGAGYWI